MNSSFMRRGRPDNGPGNKSTRRRAKWLALIAVFALPLAILVAPIARAADGPFTIDGVVPDAGATELADAFGNVKELGPKNSNATKIGVIHNAALPMLDTTNPNANVDLRRAWLDTQRDAGTSHDWLYFAWERDSNNGSGFIAYEFMQKAAPAGCAYDTATEAQLIANCNPWANRDGDTDGSGPDIGDFMILWDQQGGSKDLYLRTWSGTAPNLTLGAPTLLNTAVSQAAYSADGFRGEAAVDLTATIFGGSNACINFANTIPSTVTGNSDTADYKDTILKTAPPITNCESTLVTTPKDAAGNNIPVGGLSIGTGVVGVKDSALVSVTGGTATPTGSVSFFLCQVASPGLCTTGGTSVGSTALSGTYPVTVVSPTAYVTSAGRYCWRATWPGDSANGIGAASDSQANECFTVNPVTPTLSTDASDNVVLGNAVTDSAALGGTATQPANPVINLTGTGGAPAAGTITFTLYGPNDCTTVAYTSAAVTVSGNGTYNTPNPQFVPTAAGDYHWVAVYSGNSPNTNGVTHNANCTDTGEDVTVGPASTTTVTTPRVGSTPITAAVPVGTTVTDHAVVTGTAAGGSPTGIVNFFVCNPTEVASNGGTCSTGGTAAGSNKPLTAGVNNTSTADSDAVLANVVGTWCFRAVYVPNTANYTGSSDSSTGECFTVKDSTSGTSAQNWLPNDSATFTSTGGSALKGSVSFTLYDSADCTGTVLRTAETFAIDEASPVTRSTTNTTVLVSTSKTVSWKTEFTSDNPLVDGSTHCEKTQLVITN